MTISVAALRSSELFRNLDDRSVEQLAEVAVHRRYPKGALVFSEGDRGDAVYGVMAGMVQVFGCTVDGREIIIDARGANQCFGDLSVVDGQPRCASARAATDVALFMVCRVHFMKLLAECPALSLELLRLMARRLRWSTELVRREYASRRAPARLAHRLLQQVTAYGVNGGTGVALTSSQADLAKHACLSRQVVNHYLREWQKQAVISITRGQLVIRDMDLLASIAEERCVPAYARPGEPVPGSAAAPSLKAAARMPAVERRQA